MADDTKARFLQRWQQLSANENVPVASAQFSSKADDLRGLLSLVEYARASNMASSEASSHIFQTRADVYACLVDSPEIGLNNYADGAFACVEGNRNESAKWKTSFGIKMFDDCDYVKKFLSISKSGTHCSESDGKMDEPLTWTTALLPKHDINLPVKKFCQSALVTGSTSCQNIQKLEQPTNLMQNFSGKPVVEKRQFLFMSKTSPTESQYAGSSLSVQSSLVRRKPMRLEDISPMQTMNEPESQHPDHSAFKTARQQLVIDHQKNGYSGYQTLSSNMAAYGSSKKSLGARRGPSGKFVPPTMNKEDTEDSHHLPFSTKPASVGSPASEDPTDPRLKNIEPRLIELILCEIMDHGPPLEWEHIVGLEFAKKTIKEIVVWPMLRPDIFTGLRGPPKGLLLFGPPGTGKTLIGKCIASQSKSTFFSISASSLTSKWVGESEKMVRALFAIARVRQPSVVFIDEIDSLLTQRCDGEQESSRRIKTEFLVQLDGASTSQEDRVLVVGATNRPQEIDEAARRRFVKRLYIPLPDLAARRQIVLSLMSQLSHKLHPSDLEVIANKTEGYSGADMKNLCSEAALGPIRSLPFQEIENISEDEVRPIECRDFIDALKQVRASVSDKDTTTYLDWNDKFGSWPSL